MVKVKKTDLSHEFNSTLLKKYRDKEIKTWQWVILLCCFLFQMLPYCVALNLTSVFVPKDWTVWTDGNQTTISLTFTVGALGAAILGPVIARMFGKEINTRAIYILGVFLAMLGFFAPGINALIPDAQRSDYVVTGILWASNLILQIGVMIFSGLGINNLISKWWPEEKRGFALGVAFAGGAIGNIWMQQLLRFLAQKFGNINGLIFNGSTVTIATDGEYDIRWITYGMFALLGLITGVILAIIVGKKPITPNIFETKEITNREVMPIFCVGCNNIVDKKTLVTAALELEVSPLLTKKYTPYWILLIGFAILQMGTAHVMFNGQFITYATVANETKPNVQAQDILALGGTLFAVSCLIGSIFGGILNDKGGPTRAIAIAGILQVASMICLLFSVKYLNLVYAYFVLAGLSAYVYTVTPSYTVGKLYGRKHSNKHLVAMLSFMSLGFAIGNGVTGPIVGNIKTTTSELFNQQIHGNMLNIMIFFVAAMVVGTIITICCTHIIRKRGLKGLHEFSPTKYSSKVIAHNRAYIHKISHDNRWNEIDTRINNPKRALKIATYKENSKSFNKIESYKQNLLNVESIKQLSELELKVLTLIYFNKYITLANLNTTINKPIDNVIEKLISLEFIKEHELNEDKKYYTITNTLTDKIPLLKERNKFIKENNRITRIIDKIKNKLEVKLAKIDGSERWLHDKAIDVKLEQQYIDESEKTLIKLNENKAKFVEFINEAFMRMREGKLANSYEWKLYKKDYKLTQSILEAQSLRTYLEDEKAGEMADLKHQEKEHKKIARFKIEKEIEGHNGLMDYYNDKYAHLDQLINKHIVDAYYAKYNKYHEKIKTLQDKYSKIIEIQRDVFCSDPKYLTEVENEHFAAATLINKNEATKVIEAKLIDELEEIQIEAQKELELAQAKIDAEKAKEQAKTDAEKAKEQAKIDAKKEKDLKKQNKIKAKEEKEHEKEIEDLESPQVNLEEPKTINMDEIENIQAEFHHLEKPESEVVEPVNAPTIVNENANVSADEGEVIDIYNDLNTLNIGDIFNDEPKKVVKKTTTRKSSSTKKTSTKKTTKKSSGKKGQKRTTKKVVVIETTEE